MGRFTIFLKAFIHRVGLERWISVCLVMAVLAVYSQVIRHDFIDYDDNVYIANNSHTRTGLTLGNIRWAFGSMEVANWHPITWLSHMLDCQLYGLLPAGHHLTSLAFHLANTLALFLVLRLATGCLWRSAVVAALFGLHPIHVESVAWVSERKDVLSAFFWMLSFLAYLRYVKHPGALRYLVLGVTYGFGLMAKPMLVTLPFVFLLFDFWPLNRWGCPEPEPTTPSARPKSRSFSFLVYEKLPLFLLSAVSCVVTFIAQSRAETVSPLDVISISDRILNASISYIAYPARMIWPSGLSILYPYPDPGPPVWQGLGAFLMVAAFTLLALRFRHRQPAAMVGWLWYLGVLIPVIGLVQVGAQATADRYTYLPAIGLYIGIVWAMSGVLARAPFPRFLAGFLGLLMGLSLSFATWFQLGHWKNTETIFRHALAVTHRNHIAHFTLGSALLKQDRLEAAVTEYKRALKIHPRYTDALNNIGFAYAQQGLIQEAMDYYEKSLQTSPNHVLTHINLADALMQLGRLDEAISHYQQALTIEPDNGGTHDAMGVAQALAGRMETAMFHLSRAVDLCEDCPESLNNMGRVLMLTGRLGPAADRFRQAINHRPGFAEAHNNIGLVFLAQGALADAIDAFAAALYYRSDYTKAAKNIEKARGMMVEGRDGRRERLEIGGMETPQPSDARENSKEKGP